MMDHLQEAFAFDIHTRRDVDEHFPAAGITVVSHDVQKGTDVLVHEVIDPDAIRGRPDRPSAEVVAAIIAHHTTPEQAGEVFRRVHPRLAVYSHAPNSERVLAQTRTTYAGPLQGPEDLLTIVIGDQITVRHAPR